MNANTEERVLRFLKTIADSGNWEQFQDDYSGRWSLEWTKESYDPQYVAQDLLDLVEND